MQREEQHPVIQQAGTHSATLIPVNHSDDFKLERNRGLAGAQTYHLINVYKQTNKQKKEFLDLGPEVWPERGKVDKQERISW